MQARENMTHTHTHTNDSPYLHDISCQKSLRTWNLLKEAKRLRLTTRTFGQRVKFVRRDFALVFLASILRVRFVSFTDQWIAYFRPLGSSIGYTLGTCIGYSGLLNLDEAMFTQARPSRLSKSKHFHPARLRRIRSTKLFRWYIIVLRNCTIDSFSKCRKLLAVIELNAFNAVKLPVSLR